MGFLNLGGFNPADYDLPVDARLVLHTDEMGWVGHISSDPNTGKLRDGTLISLPSIYFCICIETKKIYSFNAENDWIEPYGKFREIVGGSGTDVIANPTSTPSAKLRTLKIGNITYDVSSKDLITEGSIPPITTTIGNTGQLYIDNTTPGLYQCTQQDNSILLADPGTPLPLCFDRGWKDLHVNGIEKILSNGGKPTEELAGVKGQLFIDTTTCDVYQCKGKASASQYIWKLVTQSKGFTLTLVQNSYTPYKILFADGTWISPTNIEQKEFRNVVAILPNLNQTITTVSGLLSQPYPAMLENKTGYTLICDTKILVREA